MKKRLNSRQRAKQAIKRLATFGLVVVILLLPVLQFTPLVTAASTAISSKLFPAHKQIRYSAHDYRPTSQDPVRVFERPVVTITFDGAWLSTYDPALQIMEDYSFNSTNYIMTGPLGSYPHMAFDHIKALQMGGHQIAASTVNHKDLVVLSAQELAFELGQPKRVLAERYGEPLDFASPLGSYNSTGIAAVQSSYRSHRSKTVGFNTRENFDVYNIRVQIITAHTTTEELEGWLLEAKQQNAWLVLVYHRVDDSKDGYSVTPAVFTSQLSALKRSGLAVATVEQVLQDLEKQNLTH